MHCANIGFNIISFCRSRTVGFNIERAPKHRYGSGSSLTFSHNYSFLVFLFVRVVSAIVIGCFSKDIIVPLVSGRTTFRCSEQHSIEILEPSISRDKIGVGDAIINTKSSRQKTTTSAIQFGNE